MTFHISILFLCIYISVFLNFRLEVCIIYLFSIIKLVPFPDREIIHESIFWRNKISYLYMIQLRVCYIQHSYLIVLIFNFGIYLIITKNSMKVITLNVSSLKYCLIARYGVLTDRDKNQILSTAK